MLVGMKQYLLVVLIYISLMTSDAEQAFMCFLATCIYIFIGEIFIHFLCPFFSWIICLFVEL